MHIVVTQAKMINLSLSLSMGVTFLQGTMGPFGLAYFRAYIKQFMQINKFLCIIYKFLRLFMKKQFMKIRFSLVRTYKLK